MSEEVADPYYDLVITRIPIGNKPDAQGRNDGCYPPATDEDAADQAHTGNSPWISVMDNTSGGDGICIRLHRKESDCEDCFVRFEMSVPALSMLIEALTAVKKLRACEPERSYK
jgi:hypothetical protein